MSQEYKPRVNLKLTQLTHKLLKVWCAEHELTIQAGATRLIEEGIKKKVGAAVAAGMIERAPNVFEYPKEPTGRAPTPPISAPATEQETRELAEYNEEIIDHLTLEEFRAKRPGIARMMGWDSDGDTGAPQPDTAPPRTHTLTAAEIHRQVFGREMPPDEPVTESHDEEDDAPSRERYTPATHDIPADWVNEYGLTLALQNALERDDNLEYGPPDRRPLAH